MFVFCFSSLLSLLFLVGVKGADLEVIKSAVFETDCCPSFFRSQSPVLYNIFSSGGAKDIFFLPSLLRINDAQGRRCKSGPINGFLNRKPNLGL